jgi:hypothetical protein
VDARMLGLSVVGTSFWLALAAITNASWISKLGSLIGVQVAENVGILQLCPITAPPLSHTRVNTPTVCVMRLAKLQLLTPSLLTLSSVGQAWPVFCAKLFPIESDDCAGIAEKPLLRGSYSSIMS